MFGIHVSPCSFDKNDYYRSRQISRIAALNPQIVGYANPPEEFDFYTDPLFKWRLWQEFKQRRIQIAMCLHQAIPGVERFAPPDMWNRILAQEKRYVSQARKHVQKWAVLTWNTDAINFMLDFVSDLSDKANSYLGWGSAVGYMNLDPIFQGSNWHDYATIYPGWEWLYEPLDRSIVKWMDFEKMVQSRWKNQRYLPLESLSFVYIEKDSVVPRVYSLPGYITEHVIEFGVSNSYGSAKTASFMRSHMYTTLASRAKRGLSMAYCGIDPAYAWYWLTPGMTEDLWSYSRYNRTCGGKFHEWTIYPFIDTREALHGYWYL